MIDIGIAESIVDLGKAAIERIWPDPVKRAEELRKLQELEQEGDIAKLNAHVKLMLAQIDVNKTEAQHKSLFVAGWRPAVGWVGVVALGYQFVLYPMLVWSWYIWQARGVIPTDMATPPILDMEILMVLLTGILGIGGMRSFDKSRGTQTDSLK